MELTQIFLLGFTFGLLLGVTLEWAIRLISRAFVTR